MSQNKFSSLWEYLKNNQENIYELSFSEIESILGFPLDHSFLSYKKEAEKYGYEVIKISLKDKKIRFKKVDC